MVNINMAQLDHIINATIDSIEASKTQICDIGEYAKKEYQKIESDLRKLKSDIIKTIEYVEKTEKNLRTSKQQLMKISQNYDTMSQDEMKQAYEKADKLRIELAVQKEREQMLIQRRNEMEIRLKSLNEIVNKAEQLSKNVAIAMNFLTGDLKNITAVIEDLSSRQLLGVKILKAQEAERQRVAREIHDGPAQSMSNVVVKAELCLKLLDRDVDMSRQELSNLKDSVRQSIQDVRRIIYDLRPMSLDDLGLIPTLERHINKVSDETGIPISFRQDGYIRSIKSIIVLTLFRIAQEALNNIVKHAEAREVEIRLHFFENHIELFIKDDGVGFDLEEVQKRSHEDHTGFGLSTMQERAELLQGECVIRSEKNKGTRLYIKIPLIQDEVNQND